MTTQTEDQLRTQAAMNDTGHSFVYAGDTGGERPRWAGNGKDSTIPALKNGE